MDIEKQIEHINKKAFEDALKQVIAERQEEISNNDYD